MLLVFVTLTTLFQVGRHWGKGEDWQKVAQNLEADRHTSCVVAASGPDKAFPGWASWQKLTDSGEKDWKLGVTVEAACV